MKREIQLLISEEFAERIIPENDSVRLLDAIIDSLDLNLLYEKKKKKRKKMGNRTVCHAENTRICQYARHIFKQRN